MGVVGQLRGRSAARVVAAAHELFASQGYGDTSLDEIAEVAGVSLDEVTSTGSKASLLRQMFSHTETAAMLGCLASLGAPGGRGLAEEMDELFARWYRRLESEPQLVRDYLAVVMHQGELRGDQEDAVLEAIALRIRAHRPTLDQERAVALAYAIFSGQVTGTMAVLIGTYTVAQARQANLQMVRALTCNI